MNKVYTLSKKIWFMTISFLQYLFGGADVWIRSLCLLMTIDIITGLIKAIHGTSEKSAKGFIDSTVMWQGGIKKILTLVVVCVATIISYLITPDTMAIRIVTISYYVAEEALSILENITACGYKPPIYLVRILEKLIKDIDNDE